MAYVAGYAGTNERQRLAADTAREDARSQSGARIVLECPPPPSQRVTWTMPHAVCVRLVGAWIAAIAVLLAVVLVLRWGA